jgi:hypothetical protein
MWIHNDDAIHGIFIRGPEVIQELKGRGSDRRIGDLRISLQQINRDLYIRQNLPHCTEHWQKMREGREQNIDKHNRGMWQFFLFFLMVCDFEFLMRTSTFRNIHICNSRNISTL